VSLGARIADRIRTGGPISVAEYMHLCLHDPADGYYATRPALGAEGDFITAPLVSQMFGELIGLWMVELWRQMGRPAPVRLVELGPGDGTLMSDLLRAARLEVGFLEAAEIWLVEPSGPFRELQRRRLGSALIHADRLEEVPAGAPFLLVGNEVLDCLPARQWEWREGATMAGRRLDWATLFKPCEGMSGRIPLLTRGGRTSRSTPTSRPCWPPPGGRESRRPGRCFRAASFRPWASGPGPPPWPGPTPGTPPGLSARWSG